MSDSQKPVSYAPTAGLSYDPGEAKYWDAKGLDGEVVRVFDICNGCRMCFKYCDSFKILFQKLDGPAQMDPRRLGPGCYALGNLLLDSPEVQPLKARVAAALPSAEPLFSVLAEAKIVNPDYGTRCSTVLLHGGTEMRYSERTFLPDGAEGDTRHYHFQVG